MILRTRTRGDVSAALPSYASHRRERLACATCLSALQTSAPCVRALRAHLLACSPSCVRALRAHPHSRASTSHAHSHSGLRRAPATTPGGANDATVTLTRTVNVSAGSCTDTIGTTAADFGPWGAVARPVANNSQCTLTLAPPSLEPAWPVDRAVCVRASRGCCTVMRSRVL